MPDVSVVIPTCRRPGLVVEAIRSALAQDGASVEVIVLDDSPDASAAEPVRALADPRVAYRRREVPSGGNPSLVRNEGWARARGTFVHFLDDDDRVVPGAYRDLLSAFAGHPRVGVAFGRVEPFGDVPSVVERERRVFRRAARKARLYQRLGWRMLFVANQLYAGPTLHVNSACLIRREHLDALGGYDERLRLVEDLEFYLRAVRAFGCVFVDRDVVEYRTGAPSLMNALRDSTPVARAYERIYDGYRARHGRAELLALKVLGKAVLRWI